MAFSVKKRFLIYSVSSLFCLSYNTIARSQPIIPDGLNTTVRTEGNKFFIEGGIINGNIQFKGLKEFNIPKGFEAIFPNGSPNISDILVRVTGNSISNLDGILTTQGGANLWVINSNGFVIGEDFVLNTEGSVTLTTAHSILFDDGSEFGINSDNAIFSSSAPVGVNFPGGKKIPDVIIIKGEGHEYNPLNFLFNKLAEEPNTTATNKNTLEASTKTNITLIAGEVNFNGARMNFKGSDLRVAAIEEGQIFFNPDNSFNVNQIKEYGKISLENASAINMVSSLNENLAPGAVEFIGKQIDIKDISFILSQNQTQQPGGTIQLTATESVNFLGEIRLNNVFSRAGIYTEIDAEGGKGAEVEIHSPKIELSFGNIYTTSISQGDAGDIKFTGETLAMSNVSVINSIVRDRSKSGAIELNMSKLIRLSEPDVEDTTSDITTNIGVINFGFGESQKVTINSNRIEVLNGAKIFNRNIALGRVNANETTEFTGKSNDLVINTDFLLVSGVRNYEKKSLQNRVESASFVGTYNPNKIDVGDLILNVKKLQVEKNGVVGSYGFSEGNTGNTTINATDSIFLNNGKILVSIETPSQEYQQEFGSLNQTGEAQMLRISSPEINAINNSEISVSNNGANKAGIADINADIIRLEDSKFTATTKGGSGELNITAKDFRISNSQITTGAAGSGTGGDINITSNIFVADRSSEILATAVDGNGGNINIKGNSGVFINGTVSADSESGIDGTVKIEGLTQEEIGQQLSSTIDPKERQPTPEVNQISNKCIGEEVPIIKESHGKPDASFDRYGDPRSNLAGLFLPEEQEPDPVIKENLAIVYLMQNAPEDPEMLEDYLNEHFNDVTVLENGSFSVGKLKNPDKVPLPDFDKLDAIYSVNYQQCN